MEPEIVNIRETTMVGLDLKPKNIPEGLCQFGRSTPLFEERCIYYKNYGLVNFAFVFRGKATIIYTGFDYARGTGFFQENNKAYMLSSVLGEDMFRVSKEEIVEIFITRGHHMSDWLLFNQDLWNNA